MLNRRIYRRTRVQRTVEIEPARTARRSRWSLPFKASEGRAAGELVDIGCGGLCAAVDAALELGTPCSVHIFGAEGRVQRTRGTVRNVRGDNGLKLVGIAFHEPVLALGDPTRIIANPPFDDSVRPQVLVVDDEPSVRSLLERFLEVRGLRVTTARDADEALDRLRAEQPALMLLDLKMPGISGIQLLEDMHAEGLRVPNVWAMSAYVSDEDALAALSLGAAEFINKPFDLDHLDFSLQLLGPLL
jgi:CheY-like chemotaxis protein